MLNLLLACGPSECPPGEIYSEVLGGCVASAGTASDADTDTDADTDADADTWVCDDWGYTNDGGAIQDVCSGCNGSICTYDVRLNDAAKTLEVDIADTHRETVGIWEHHSAFTVIDEAHGRIVQRIELQLVATYDEFVEDTSTTFNLADSASYAMLSFMWSATDEYDDYYPCVTTGEEPNWDGSDCVVVD